MNFLRQNGADSPKNGANGAGKRGEQPAKWLVQGAKLTFTAEKMGAQGARGAQKWARKNHFENFWGLQKVGFEKNDPREILGGEKIAPSRAKKQKNKKILKKR